ncbi:riboflavin synthase [Thermocrinis sp.]|uniref:riboflavin synthase n=1 Tax=Thermocrinis sp. TaxID=2024383 RepID=UPI002FDED16B
MFSGLVEEVGIVEELKLLSGGAKLTIRSTLGDIKIGDSIAVNGVCLTVVDTHKGTISFDLSQETLSRSNLKLLKKGDPVNLERALRVGDRIGGHFLQGHVDFTSKVLLFSQRGSHWELKTHIPEEYREYVVEKGSIGIDGISLTINYVEQDAVSINIIPHTYEKTNLKHRKAGDLVNVELDILGKYVINYVKLITKDRKLEKLWRDFWG